MSNNLVQNPNFAVAVLIVLMIGMIAHWRMTKSTFWSWIAVGTSMFLTYGHFVMNDPLWTMLWGFILAMDLLFLFYIRPRREAQEKENAPEV